MKGTWPVYVLEGGCETHRAVIACAGPGEPLAGYGMELLQAVALRDEFVLETITTRMTPMVAIAPSAWTVSS